MTTLQERIERGEVIILDGGTGTELERRGVPMDGIAWSGAALLTHSDIVRQVHEDYIRAGADIIITNSFSTARHVLEPAGLGEQFRELNRRAVALARQARQNVADRPIAIAGSISTFSPKNDIRNDPSPAQAQANYREQADILAEAGVDLIIIEMVRDIEQTIYAVKAAVAGGLPVWVGFSCKIDDDDRVMLWDQGDTLAAGLETIPGLGVAGIAVMHTLTEDISPTLSLVLDHWSGPVGVYAHSGKFIMPNWQFTDMISPEAYATEAQKWVELGVQIVGGCCGIGPEHIRVLKERLPSMKP